MWTPAFPLLSPPPAPPSTNPRIPLKDGWYDPTLTLKVRWNDQLSSCCTPFYVPSEMWFLNFVTLCEKKITFLRKKTKGRRKRMRGESGPFLGESQGNEEKISYKSKNPLVRLGESSYSVLIIRLCHFIIVRFHKISCYVFPPVIQSLDPF